MSKAKAEQTRGTRHASPKCKQWEKKRLHRIRRRAEKRDPQGAPRTLKGYMKGWAD